MPPPSTGGHALSATRTRYHPCEHPTDRPSTGGHALSATRTAFSSSSSSIKCPVDRRTRAQRDENDRTARQGIRDLPLRRQEDTRSARRERVGPVGPHMSHSLRRQEDTRS